MFTLRRRLQNVWPQFALRTRKFLMVLPWSVQNVLAAYFHQTPAKFSIRKQQEQQQFDRRLTLELTMYDISGSSDEIFVLRSGNLRERTLFVKIDAPNTCFSLCSCMFWRPYPCSNSLIELISCRTPQKEYSCVLRGNWLKCNYCMAINDKKVEMFEIGFSF